MGGMIEDDPLAIGATTMTSQALAALPLITAGSNYAAITLDPDGTEGEPEIVWVTEHTTLSQTATILREPPGENSTAREHSNDTYWVHAPTTLDYETIKAYGGGGELYNNGGNTSGATTVDLTSGNTHRYVLTGNWTPGFSGTFSASRAHSFTLFVVQDATGGRTITWPASVKWAYDETPLGSSAANAVDVYSFITIDAGTSWYGFMAGKDMR